MGREEERETLHGAPQRAKDVQDFYEAAAAIAQVNTPVLRCLEGFIHATFIKYQGCVVKVG